VLFAELAASSSYFAQLIAACGARATRVPTGLVTVAS
jgi:hypothetical protein